MTDDELADKNLKMAIVSHKYAQGCKGKDGGINGRYRKDSNETSKEKNTTSKMKNTLNRINSRLETWEENTHELGGLWRKTTRNEALREKWLGGMLFGTTASLLTRVPGVLDKRGTKTLTWKSACPKAQWDRDWDGTESIDQLEMTAETTDFPGHQHAGSLFTYVLLRFSAVCCNFLL